MTQHSESVFLRSSDLQPTRHAGERRRPGCRRAGSCRLLRRFFTSRIAFAGMLLGLVLLGWWDTSVLLAQQPSTDARPWLQRLRDSRPIILGHRSCWREVSENSLEGIRACAEHGIDAGEVDVRATKDGVLVLMHDDTLDRMTTMKGAVADHTYEEIQQGHLRQHNGGPNAAPTDERVPTLAEALRVAKGHIVLILDVKVPLYVQIRSTVIKERAEEWIVMPTQEKPGSPEFAKLPDWAQRHAVFSVAECRGANSSPGCVNTPPVFRQNKHTGWKRTWFADS